MAIEVSKEGISQASQNLLNCTSELSELFDNIAQITSSIGTNLTGFSEVEELVIGLKEMDSVKDSLISKINEFGNYLTSTVIEGYDSFMNALGSIDIDTSFLTTLASLFEVKLGSDASTPTPRMDLAGDESVPQSSNNNNASSDNSDGNTIPYDTWVEYDDGNYKGKVIYPSDPVDPGMSVGYSPQTTNTKDEEVVWKTKDLPNGKYNGASQAWPS